MCKLIIHNNILCLSLLQSFVTESAKIYNIDRELISKLKLVTEEAFLYVLKNSFEDGEKAAIEIKTEVRNSFFELSFFDKGLPVDLSLTKEYSKDSLCMEGIEFFLIKEYSDKVSWINHGFEGKEFRLSFKIPLKNIFSLAKSEGIKPKHKISLDDIEIRAFKDSDAIKISRIIYKAYGYTYPNEDMYYPEKILESNKNAKLISVVSYDTKNKEVVGHYALERPDLGSIAESGQAVVSPDCRGFGLMKKMRVLLEKSANELGLDGICSQPVTSHTYSQQVNEGFGSSACGFSFGLVPQKLSFKQIDSSLSQRESCFLYFKAIRKRERVLYLPKQHEKMLKEIYDNLNLTYEDKISLYTKKNGIVKSNFSNGWGIGVIDVEEVGDNNFKEIKTAFYNLLFNLKADVIFLNISLEDGSIDELVEKVESEKFFFSGVHPSLLNKQDAIRFEFLNGSIDESKIKIFADKSRKLFNYILGEKKRALS